MIDTEKSSSPQDNTAPDRLLLGLAGWPHPQWQGSYFPDDLPQDWQFAYYSNDAGCIVLSAPQWQALDVDELEDWLEDVPAHFRFYLELAGGAPDAAQLQAFGEHLGGLLLDQRRQIASAAPQLCQIAEGQWADESGQVRLLRWQLDKPDLRALRARLEAAPAGIEAIVFEGEGLDPAMLGDIRTLCELLGLA